MVASEQGMMSDGYEIRVRHRLGPPVSFLLRDLEPRFGHDVTILWLDGNDQPALQGTLRRLGDLGLEIVSVERMDAES